MIYKNGTDPKIEQRKARLGLSGDVYIYDDHFIEDMAGHRRLIPDSTAETIEEAYAERVEYEASKTLSLDDALDMLEQLGVDISEPEPEPEGEENNDK